MVEIRWKQEVFDNHDIDSIADDLDYYAVAIGWLLAQGYTPSEATTIAGEWRYKKGIA